MQVGDGGVAGEKKGDAFSSGKNAGLARAVVLAALGLAVMWGARATMGATGVELPLAVGTPQILSSDVSVDTGFYSVINEITGATRFYDNGYFGGNAVVANVEAGFAWNGHETTGYFTSYISNAPINTGNPQYDYHATAVGFTIAGLGPQNADGSYYYYQLGMAPGAFLSSVAIATGWVGTGGEFTVDSSTFAYGYKTVMHDGILRPLFPGNPNILISVKADVVNSSWGFEDATGQEQYTMILDALTAANHQTVCVAAGNHDSDVASAQVGGPASGFNVIAVGALGDDTTRPPYQAVAGFSNTGPNDFYNPATGETIHNVRPGVAIVAPGSDLILPAYIGKTGTNANGDLFDDSGFPPELLNQLYFFGAAGTSFASPIVAGGAALLVDAGYANFGTGPAEDGRVIKAVLLNSADKTAGWTNNPTMVNGVLVTAQGLDFNVGAGALDLNRAYDQYLSGTRNVASLSGGTVHRLGWAYGHVKAGTPNDYAMDMPLAKGEMLTTTLTWFIPVAFNGNATADSVTDAFSDADLHDRYFDQLDLQVWLVADGMQTLIAESTSPYNNVDQLYFAVPEDGFYLIRVSYAGTTYDLGNDSPHADDFALAWSVVPEPGGAGVTLAMVAWMLVAGRGGYYGRRLRGVVAYGGRER